MMAWSSSKPQASLTFDGINFCCTTARTAVYWPEAANAGPVVLKNALRRRTSPGILPFCCQLAG